MTARAAALWILERFRRQGKFADDALDEMISKRLDDPREAALCTRLVYSVLQNMALCDFYIGCYSSVKLNKLEPKLLDILRLSVCQILFFDRIPASAAVNEGVRLCRSNKLERAAGLCNAVLRRVAENRDALPEIPNPGTAENIARRYSTPIWLTERFIELFGFDGAESLLRVQNEPSITSAQLNTLKEGAKIPEGRLTAAMEEFRRGDFYFQDDAARYAVSAAGPVPGMSLLDICAAPGGKSFTAAMDMRGEGEIIACDVSAERLRSVTREAERLGIECISVREMDASEPSPEFFDRFDAVLADVPCSGFGVIRKKPDIRYKSAEEIAALPELQLKILRGAALCVRPGGVLVYSTCTLLREENEEITAAFLAENSGFEREGFALPEPIGEVKGGEITLLPHVHGTDGFFICKMRRKNAI